MFVGNASWAATITGTVVGVTDGDTITVLDSSKTQYKIRLAGIDAPEKKQDFGNASKKSLSDMVFQEHVSVEWTKEDRYGRVVGKILLKGQDVNLLQLKNGMAWFYRKYQNELTQDDRLVYLHAEEDASSQKIGIWSIANPMAPWDFRKSRRAN